MDFLVHLEVEGLNGYKESVDSPSNAPQLPMYHQSNFTSSRSALDIPSFSNTSTSLTSSPEWQPLTRNH